MNSLLKIKKTKEEFFDLVKEVYHFGVVVRLFKHTQGM